MNAAGRALSILRGTAVSFLEATAMIGEAHYRPEASASQPIPKRGSPGVGQSSGRNILLE